MPRRGAPIIVIPRKRKYKNYVSRRRNTQLLANLRRCTSDPIAYKSYNQWNGLTLPYLPGENEPEVHDIKRNDKAKKATVVGVEGENVLQREVLQRNDSKPSKTTVDIADEQVPKLLDNPGFKSSELKPFEIIGKTLSDKSAVKIDCNVPSVDNTNNSTTAFGKPLQPMPVSTVGNAPANRPAEESLRSKIFHSKYTGDIASSRSDGDNLLSKAQSALNKGDFTTSRSDGDSLSTVVKDAPLFQSLTDTAAAQFEVPSKTGKSRVVSKKLMPSKNVTEDGSTTKRHMHSRSKREELPKVELREYVNLPLVTDNMGEKEEERAAEQNAQKTVTAVAAAFSNLTIEPNRGQFELPKPETGDDKIPKTILKRMDSATQSIDKQKNEASKHATVAIVPPSFSKKNRPLNATQSRLLATLQLPPSVSAKVDRLIANAEQQRKEKERRSKAHAPVSSKNQ